jgi:hypothetical protein
LPTRQIGADAAGELGALAAADPLASSRIASSAPAIARSRGSPTKPGRRTRVVIDRPPSPGAAAAVHELAAMA